MDVRHLLSLVSEELGSTIKKPSRVLAIFSKDRRRLFSGHFRAKMEAPQIWEEETHGSRRGYKTYEEYLLHQTSGLKYLDLSSYDLSFAEELRKRLGQFEFLREGTTVLCLAARAGTEVKAFLQLGCFAVGIDINNRAKNPYVLYGDFHQIQFPDNSTDVIYTNSIDHVFDINRFVGEIRRVLKKNGFLVLEASHGGDKGQGPGVYEAYWWRNIDEMTTPFEKEGFKKEFRMSFEVPWPGEMLVFRNGK